MSVVFGLLGMLTIGGSLVVMLGSVAGGAAGMVLALPIGLGGIVSGLLLIGLGIGLGHLSSIRSSLRRLVSLQEGAEDAADERILERMMSNHHRSALALRTLAEAAGPINSGHSDAIVAYMRKVDGVRLDRADRIKLAAWIAALPVDPAELPAAVRSLSGLSRAARDLFRAAIDDIEKATKGRNENQQRLVAHYRRMLDQSPVDAALAG